MTLKKTAQQKRASLPLKSDYTKTFAKDWESLTRSGKYDMNQIKAAMLLIISNDGPLPPEYLDHPLKGEWEGFRECHIGGDFLMIYELTGKRDAVVFTRAGTHTQLFE
jgi:mRNA interferase YafQ